MAFAINVNTSRLELAQYMAGHSKAPEQALEAVFTGAMEALKERATVPINSETEARIWKVVSTNRLEVVKNTFLQAFCNHILAGLSDNEITRALEEHRRTGYMTGPIQKAYLLKYNKTIEAVTKQVTLISKEWMPDLINALQAEKIFLS
jgi:hypothetical protein